MAGHIFPQQRFLKNVNFAALYALPPTRYDLPVVAASSLPTLTTTPQFSPPLDWHPAPSPKHISVVVFFLRGFHPLVSRRGCFTLQHFAALPGGWLVWLFVCAPARA